MDAPIRGVALLRAGVGAALTVFPDRVASAAEGRRAAPAAGLGVAMSVRVGRCRADRRLRTGP